MLSAGSWIPNQPNTILFVLVDPTGLELTGLGNTFVLQISKDGNAFSASAGTKSEVGFGWYKYVSTAGEADTMGPIAIVVTHASILQQNLEYVVATRVVTAIDFPYTVTSTASGHPVIPGVQITVTLDAGGSQIIWTGFTDSFGVARDENGNLPHLEPGVYFFFRYKYGFTFDNPDEETVSP